ncbi:MAG: hypothetical protein FJ298_07065 [Planctomycetes bacterium]|nr:hypothetical protein [Planctomycetota bacterium]
MPVAVLVLSALGCFASALGGVRGQDRTTEAAPARALDDAALRAACFDLLGRPPLEAERTAWLGRARHEFLDHWLGRRETWSQWVEEQLYYFFLIDNFRPENERVGELPQLLAAAKLDVRSAIHRIALSPSFDQRNPGADTFVTVVMEQLNGLRVQKNVRELEVGKAMYDGHPGAFLGKSGATQADLLRIAIEDRSFVQQLVAREYRRIVRTEPDKTELALNVRRFQRDPAVFRALLREWMLSEAWDARVRSRTSAPNRIWIAALHVDLLGREPLPEESRRLRTALDGLSDTGPLRSVLARVLIDSGQVRLPEKAQIEDPTQWIAGLFTRLLGRAPSPAELRTFVTVFHEPECRPHTVLYALVTHPEYQTY